MLHIQGSILPIEIVQFYLIDFNQLLTFALHVALQLHDGKVFPEMVEANETWNQKGWVWVELELA